MHQHRRQHIGLKSPPSPSPNRDSAVSCVCSCHCQPCRHSSPKLGTSPLPQHAHSGDVSLAHFSVSAPAPFLLLSIIALIRKLDHPSRLTHRSLPCGVTPASLAHTPGFRGSCRNPSFTLKLRLDPFTPLLLAAQGLCPPHREKAGLPGLATMTLVQILDFLLFPVNHAIIFFPEFSYLLSHRNNYIFTHSGSSFLVSFAGSSLSPASMWQS